MHTRRVGEALCDVYAADVGGYACQMAIWKHEMLDVS